MLYRIDLEGRMVSYDFSKYPQVDISNLELKKVAEDCEGNPIFSCKHALDEDDLFVKEILSDTYYRVPSDFYM